MLRKLLVLLLTLVPVTACGTTTVTVVDPLSLSIGAICEVWKPISWAVEDTDRTIREVKSNNAARGVVCGDNSG
jgi:hypothetical protein